MKRFALLLALASVPVLAQDAHTIDPEGACGPHDAKIKVDSSKDEVKTPPSMGSATVVFVVDQLVARPGAATCFHCEVPVLLGMDGRWIAGGIGVSHMNVSVEPGDHHFCSRVSLGGSYLPAMYGFHADANKVYFLVARLSVAIGGKSDVLELSLANDDQGRFLSARSKQASLSEK
jgi:hypothetical protein